MFKEWQATVNMVMKFVSKKGGEFPDYSGVAIS